MSRKRKVTLIVVTVVVVLAAASALGITMIEQNHHAMAETVIEDFDLSLIPDGTYTGDYSAFPVAVQVEVTVKDHAIAAINLIRHTNGRGSDADVIPEKVVQSQTLLVDTVSGATHSSKVILLAIHNALENAAGE